MDTEDIKVLKPFGPTIAKVKIPENLVKELNDYTDSIISNDQKKKDLDWGKNLVGNVKQEFVIEKDFMEKIGWGKFLATNVRAFLNKTELTAAEYRWNPGNSSVTLESGVGKIGDILEVYVENGEYSVSNAGVVTINPVSYTHLTLPTISMV